MYMLPWICVLGLFVSVAEGVDLKAVIPLHLVECYKNKTLLYKGNLLPMSISVLIALVRKVEDYQGLNMDIRTLSSALVHRFRLDGVERNPQVREDEHVLPYSPSGAEFYRFKILMEGLIPGNVMNFPTNSLSSVEKCTLHWMLSSSVDRWMRGDEGSVCNQLNNYRSSWQDRIPRSASMEHNNEDVEMFNPISKPSSTYTRTGNFQRSGIGLSYDGYGTSSCPIENGVIYTRWGSVKAGVVLAGIAAGMQPQTVSTRNLFDPSRTPSGVTAGRQYPGGGSQYPGGGSQYPGGGSQYPRSGSQFPTGGVIDNKWAATIAGELAEVALLQGPTMGQSMQIGLTGGWNETVLVAPKYFFLSEDKPYALTDTDIRGSIDGLVLGNNVKDWSDRVGGGGIKLSQLLDMYYSERGVFSEGFRACQRRERFTVIAPMNQLQLQTSNFAQILQNELPVSVNLELPAIVEFTEQASSKLNSYVSTMSEPNCPLITSMVSKVTSRAQADLYVVIDMNWPLLDLTLMLGYLYYQMDVSKFGSNFTLINGKDGSEIIVSSQSVLDLYSSFTQDTYYTSQRGFDLPRTMRELKTIFERKMEADKYLSLAGGMPRVVLFIPYSPSSVTDNDRNYAIQRAYYFRRDQPDIKFLYLSTGSKDRFAPLVDDPNRDVFTLSMTDVAISIDHVVNRISETPNRIINPSCGYNWAPSSSYVNYQWTEYIQPRSIKYYRIHPNYFYKSNDAKISIQAGEGSGLTVCQSRYNPLPGGNQSQSSVQCRQLSAGSGWQSSSGSSSGTYDMWLNADSCPSDYALECPPLYFSVATAAQVQAQSGVPNQCTDPKCRYPDTTRFTISHQGLTCYSSVASLVASPLIILAVTILRFSNII